MSGCEKILRADLVKSENFTNIVLPNSGQQITNYIFYTADNRAGSCVLSLRADHCLATKWGSSFLYIYATNFCTQMPNSEKVSAGAPGVPDATANARKRVSKPVQAKPTKHYYQVDVRAISTESLSSNLVFSSVFPALSKAEAIGMACNYIGEHWPAFAICPKKIICRTINLSDL